MLRNDEIRYGAGTKILHWLTVTAVTVQFVVGYVLRGGEDDDHGGAGGDALGVGRHGGGGEGGQDHERVSDLLPVHVGLGLLILTLAVVRVAWRASNPPPPWAEYLSPVQRRALGLSERTLLLCLFLIPLTGLAVLIGSASLLVAHIATHVLFFTALAAHVGIVVGHTVVRRDAMLARMT